MTELSSQNGLIVKSNELIQASYRLSTMEQRVVLKLISQIKCDDTSLRRYKFKISEFEKVLGIKNNSLYSELRKITRKLTTKPLTILNDDKLVQVTWLAGAQYLDGQGELELEFSSFLSPYLIRLKEKFTKYYLENIISLRSSYSIRIYELLKQYENLSYRCFCIDDFRKKIGLMDTEYPLYANLKQKVLLVAQKELLQKTDIFFEFEEIKEGRKITTLKFIINSKSDVLPQEVRHLAISSSESSKNITNKNVSLKQQVQSIVDDFKEIYNCELDKNCTKLMIKEKGIEHVKECLQKYKKHTTCRNINNMAADFFTFVTRGYVDPKGKQTLPNNMINFEQRHYTDEDFENVFVKFED